MSQVPGNPDLANETHIRSVLIMLPYNEYLAQENGRLDFKHTRKSDGDVFSFKDAHGKPVHFKMIANSDSHLPPALWGKDHDAAAFMRVDDNGKPLLSQGKPDITVTFPGFNDKNRSLLSLITSTDTDEAMQEMNAGTSYEEKFFSDFVYGKLQPALRKQQPPLELKDVKTVGHSMGGKHLYEYAMRFGTQDNLMIESSDRHDDVIAAASAKTLREMTPSGNKDTDARAYNSALKANIENLVNRVTEISGQEGAKGPLGMEFGEKTVYSPESYNVRGAGHETSGFLFKKAEDLKPYPATGPRRVSPQGVVDVANTEYQYLGETMKGSEVLLSDRIRFQLAADGFSEKDVATIQRINAELGRPGLQVASMKQLQTTYLAPAVKSAGRIPD